MDTLPTHLSVGIFPTVYDAVVYIISHTTLRNCGTKIKAACRSGFTYFVFGSPTSKITPRSVRSISDIIPNIFSVCVSLHIMVRITCNIHLNRICTLIGRSHLPSGQQKLSVMCMYVWLMRRLAIKYQIYSMVV